MKRQRRDLIAAALPLGAAALLRGGLAHGQDKPQTGGHLRVGYTIEPTSLDPVAGRSGGDTYYWRPMFDQLIDLDQAGLPDPSTSLAKSWETTQDPASLILNLREGVKFHDGTPFNAEAVRKNIDRILDPATKATPRNSLLNIRQAEVLGEYRVKLNLVAPWAAGFGLLADRGGAVSSPAAIARLGQDYGWNPSGTGPFKLKQVVTGSHLHLVRNEHYWGRDKAGNPLPYLDEVTIRIIKDETVLASALRSGDIDVAYLPNKAVDDFLADSRFNISRMAGGSIGATLVYNPDMAPMNDINLRRAIAHAINPADINKAVFFGKGQVADSGMWPVNSWVHQPSKARAAYDLKKAKEALAAAGKPNGFEVSIMTWNSPNLQQTAEIVRAQLSRVGIKASIEILTVGSSAEKMWGAKDHPLMLTSWSRYPEPDHIASLNYKSGGYYNASRQVNAAIDAKVHQGSRTYDQAQHKVIYNEINDIVLGNVAWHPLIYATFHAAAPKKVENLNRLMAWDGKMNLKEIWLRK